jgi:hypothetical protein
VNRTGRRKSLGGVGIFAAGGIISAGFGIFGFMQHVVLHSKEGRSNFSELLGDIGLLLVGAFLIGISIHRIAEGFDISFGTKNRKIA